MNTISAKQMDTSKPQHLVIFKEASERNVENLSKVLKRAPAKGVRGVKEGVSLLAAGESGVHPRVFDRLGVATADLSESQVATLRKQDNVALVVENLVRELPPVRRSSESIESEGSPIAGSPIAAYLRGLRDAANMALAFQEGRTATPMLEPAELSPAAMDLMASLTWGLRAIGVTVAGAPTGRGIKVAVVDTGIDLHHPDFQDRVIEGDSAQCFVQGVSVQDVNGHGTHCAGTIAGPMQPRQGMRYGVAPDVQLLVGKVFNNRPRPSASDDDILDAIAWADQKGARVISMSLGSERKTGEKFADLYETVAERLLNRLSQSVLLVAAAGNESERPYFTAPVGNPAACPSVLAVAAVDRRNRIASFSCRQMDEIGQVDVSAPGVAIYSSYAGGGYDRLDGTSMATPHVAGMAALYLQREPNLTARQLFDLLKRNSRGIGDVADYGAGLIRL